MPEDGAVAHKPPNLAYDEAAALSFGGTTALGFFRSGKVQSGERVLIMAPAAGRAEDLRFLAELAEAGNSDRSLIGVIPSIRS
jgi:hypothetical protein